MEDREQLVPSTSNEVDQIDADEAATSSTEVGSVSYLPKLRRRTNENIMEQSWCSLRQRVVGAPPRDQLSHEIIENISTQFESLDYDICENRLMQNEERTKGYKFVVKKRFARWIVFFFIGVVTALIACCIDIAIEELSHYKFYYMKHFVDSCMSERRMYIPLLYWVATNIVPVLIGTLLVTYVEPVAAGSGIPQVKCYLNGVKIARVVRIKTLLVKSIGVTCSVLGGLAVGKEGPMIHSGAVVAAGISQGKTTSLAKDFHFFNYFREDHEKRDFVSGGAAAGVAAAFGAPMGGVLFSLEEGSSFWNQSLTWRIFFASMISTFTLNVVLSAYHGFAGQLSYSGLLNFGAFPNMSYEIFEIPLFILLGALGGVLGALFNFANLKLTLFRMKYITKRWMKVVEVLVVASVSATVAYTMIMLIDDCRPLGQDPTKYPVQMYCGDGEYSAAASIWFQNPEASVRSLFHDPPGSHNPLTVGVFFLIYFSLSCWTYGLSVSSGLFIPSLLTGAAWGRLAGMFLEFLFPTSAWAQPGKYALIGAASQLGGTVRMTISLTVILIEATANITFGLPLMITLITAKWVGDLFNEGIYDIHIHLSGVPILGWDPPPLSHNIFASDFMSYPVIKLNCVESVARIVDILKSDNGENHCGFPVVTSIYNEEESGRPGSSLCGLILRSQLIVLLQNKIFMETKDEWMNKSISLKLFRDAYPRYPKIQQIHISELERTFSIDLRPFMNPAPYTVPLAASLPRVFKLFRGLGLRHLPVMNDKFEVVGIVTRKDLAKYGSGS
ncbi:H(+)/Cl(-) exchange transporter 7 [Neocloeon triangulifer]|uniref:H(+)/Cl(-) exchange transporter 7 n=1 Tax=Neocloeon triangulifer TaxID=2078957 RepID=UPI00286F964B|nr:H(+)/Cl(-) exchange transporter 7 [Neocloeon triangulifer]